MLRDCSHPTICHMSHFMFHVQFFLSVSDKVEELVGGGSVCLDNVSQTWVTLKISTLIYLFYLWNFATI